MQYAQGDNILTRMQIKPQFVKLSSYEDSETTGRVKGAEVLETMDLAGKNILIVEDMIDTGTTMKTVLEKIQSLYEPKSLRVAVAFHKMTPKNVEWGYFADYTGFLVPCEFFCGYGMDFNGHLRDLPHLCVLNELGKTSFTKAALAL